MALPRISTRDRPVRKTALIVSGDFCAFVPEQTALTAAIYCHTLQSVYSEVKHLGRVQRLLVRRRASKRTGSTHGLAGWFLAGAPILLLAAVASGILGAGLSVYLIFSADLPKIPDLRAYRPKTVSTFYAEDGTVIGVFYKEKRFPVSVDSLPPHVINAFLAAEDARFFSHTGVDLFGVTRALVKNLKAGNFSQGGSTITQQVTRNFILSKEKRISRKIREAILSFRLEKTLTKKEILELYLNEIYLGKGAYGVEAAARTYFGKGAPELSVAEAATLAGLVSNPSKYSPNRNLEASLKRRDFVLASMLRCTFIVDDQYQDAIKEAPKLRESLSTPYERVPYFTETARQYIIAKYGANRLYNEGLQVWTTCDISLQDKAQETLLKGAMAWEKRQGRPSGLVRRLKPAEVREFLSTPRKESYQLGDSVQAVVITNHSRSPQKGKGKQKDSPEQELTLALQGDKRFVMELKSPVAFRPNDLLEFRVKEADGSTISVEHDSFPAVEGALVCIENNTGYVRALAGGLDFDRSHFNRAVQALRQPGSAFKPFVYAAALEYAGYSPNTLIIDDPIAVVTGPTRPEWIPRNSDGQYQGMMTLRDALARSRNVAAVKLLMDVGIEPTISLAQTMGIHTTLDKTISLSLGTSEVTPLELTSAYSVFPNMGIRIAPVLVKKVVDRFGRVLEDNTMEPLDISAASVAGATTRAWPYSSQDGTGGMVRPRPASGPAATGLVDEMRKLTVNSEVGAGIESLLAGVFPASAGGGRPPMERVLNPAPAYLMLSALREVCISGTAASVSRMRRRDLAGKTGTTDDCTDAWFVGFNPKYTTGVWIGHDAKVSLGGREHGATAALPVWKEFMAEALRDDPSQGYPPPPGVAFSAEVALGRNPRWEALLEAKPDFDPSVETKEICAVDMAFTTASAPPHAMMGFPIGSYGYFPSTEGLRVLSPTGQPAGQSYYVTDQRGNVRLQREDYVDADESKKDKRRPEPAREPVFPLGRNLEGFVTWFLRNLQMEQ
jgi:penicillin-binding protein 1A